MKPTFEKIVFPKNRVAAVKRIVKSEVYVFLHVSRLCHNPMNQV